MSESAPPSIEGGALSRFGETMREAFVLFLLALLILPPIIWIRRVRRFFRDHPNRNEP